MVKITLNACDVCQATTPPIETYTLEGGGKTAKVDLCEEHALPVRWLMHDHELSTDSAPAGRRGEIRRTPRYEQIRGQHRGRGGRHQGQSPRQVMPGRGKAAPSSRRRNTISP